MLVEQVARERTIIDLVSRRSTIDRLLQPEAREWREGFLRLVAPRVVTLAETTGDLVALLDSRLAELLENVTEVNFAVSDLLVRMTGVEELRRIVSGTATGLSELTQRVGRLELEVALGHRARHWRATGQATELAWPWMARWLAEDAVAGLVWPAFRNGVSVAGAVQILTNYITEAIDGAPPPRAWFTLGDVFVAARAPAAQAAQGTTSAVELFHEEPTLVGRRLRRGPLVMLLDAAGQGAGAMEIDDAAARLGLPRCFSTHGLVRAMVHEVAEAYGSVAPRLQLAVRGDDEAPAQATAPTWTGGRSRRRAIDVVADDLGLVFGGGGAKGAYELGAAEAIADAGLEPRALAGASVGALNAAVLASHPTFLDGIIALRSAWEYMAATSADAAVIPADPQSPIDWARALQALHQTPLRAGDYLGALADQFIDPLALQRGPNLWVSLTPSGQNPLQDVLASKLKLRRPKWKHVQSASTPMTARDMVLASAAVPFLLPPRRVDGKPIRDGGLVDNLPVRPLVSHGCRAIVVVPLDFRTRTDSARHAPDISLIHVRPTEALAPEGLLGGIAGLLDFRPETIERLRALGYQDANHELRELKAADAGDIAWTESRSRLRAAMASSGRPGR